MHRTSLALISFACFVGVGCSPSDADPTTTTDRAASEAAPGATGSPQTPALPVVFPERDEAVTALLPDGSYTITMTSLGGTEFSGYANFGDDPLGDDCELDVTYTGPQGPGFLRRADGGPTFVSADGDEWTDVADADSNAPLTLSLSDLLVANSGPGNADGTICSITILDRVATLDDPGTAMLSWDAAKLGQLRWAVLSDFTNEFTAASGASHQQRDEALTNVSLGVTELDALAQRVNTSITSDASGVITIDSVQSTGGASAGMLVLTPADSQDVVAPKAATFFERVRSGDVDTSEYFAES